MGGGAMRTAAKAAALGGYRSVGPFAGHPAAWRAPKPASAALSAPAGSSNSIGFSEKGLREVASVSVIHGPAGEIHDWELPGWGGEEQEVVLDSLRPAPRLVCGPVPSLEEAKEATSDLKDALEKVNFSTSTNESAIKVPSGSTCYEASSVIPSMPRRVVQAFSLLQGNPEAQAVELFWLRNAFFNYICNTKKSHGLTMLIIPIINAQICFPSDVVASLASDKNVWDAVMRNEKVMEFFRTHQSIVLHPESNAVTEAPLADGNPRSSTAEATTNSAFAHFVRNIKVTLAEMVNNISSFLQELLGTSPGASSSPGTKTGHNTDDLSANFDVGASFVALAVATILVVLLKRG
ncbi:hypothetical protein MUK42_19186 [Musa troglodytarum]|uniref:Uncharacterized protein n=1 Tax=Musa troglodytarum TaxID=320322 RepID=A0A9E7FUA8_9LILI|nr:hypothetical protein MUK42_19186 [Musa troglodytarum]